MKRSTKAALLSGLIFPGVGHLYLKQRPRGYALLLVALAALWFVVSDAVERAQGVVDRMLSGDVALDPGSVARMVAEQGEGADSLLVNVALAVAVGCWLTGIVDSYRLGRRRPEEQAE